MTDKKEAPLWARQVAARATGTPMPEKPVTDTERPAWERALADRLAGHEPDPETVREARAAVRPAPSEWERRILARVGHDVEDDRPPAA